MSITTRARHTATDARPYAHRGAHAVALWGLAARGVLYLLLALLSIELVSGSADDVDTRGALHRLAHSTLGAVLLVALAIGFAGFALWHLFSAVRSSAHGQEAARRIGDLVRAVVYGFLCAIAIAFLTTSTRTGNSDQTDQTWTGRVLRWSGGQLVVAAIGLVVIGCGLYLLWRALSGGPQDEPAVLDAAPQETPALHALGAIGNAARGTVVGLLGLFLLVAAIEHDPSESVGLDGALKRLLDNSWGDVAVVLVALGFAAFGVYSIARAWVNREQAHAVPS
ncbi:MAG TPA: DUF1206 domain-containing protein [Acidimicrobiia bacterium]|jgi:hypothetical protein